MEQHWRDVRNRKDEWGYLEVNVVDDMKPTLRLHSGGANRFKLVNQANPVFWGNIAHDYQGAWFLRNDNEWELDQMPVRPITSQDIENSLALVGDDLSAYWCRFFAQSLADSKASPLYQGKWQLTSKGGQVEQHDYALPVDSVKPENRFGFYHERPLWVDWGMSGSYILLSLKSVPDEENGRVKWWRKQVRQGTCPPALIWHIQSLSAYIVLDGHCRLRAFELENKMPEFVELSSVIEHKFEVNEPRAEAVYKNLEERQQHRWKNPLNVDEINNLLIHIFDNTPLKQSINKAKASKLLASEWLKEVQSFSGLPGTDEPELRDMIGNKHPEQKA